MNREELVRQIFRKKSYLCVGLDPDPAKMPEFFFDYKMPLFEFNKAIIEATHDLAVSFKPNFAFYESMGLKGMKSLKQTLVFLKKCYPEILVIADAKRGDIGNTSAMYAREMFVTYNCDAVTINPYMGFDCVEPFLQYRDKWVILTALTSNPGAFDFQFFDGMNGRKLYEEVLYTSKKWASSNNLMFVAGATKAVMFEEIRKIVPDYFLLVPGVGQQGGNLEEVSRAGFNSDCGLLVNASRSILYASDGTDFAEKARDEDKRMQNFMRKFLKEHIDPVKLSEAEKMH